MSTDSNESSVTSSLSSFSDSSSDSSNSSDSSCSSSDVSFFQICLLSLKLLQRAEKYHQARVSWEYHAVMLHHENQFDSTYRTSYDSFMKLVDILSPAIQQNDKKV
jgi:hypothetical protein